MNAFAACSSVLFFASQCSSHVPLPLHALLSTLSRCFRVRVALSVSACAALIVRVAPFQPFCVQFGFVWVLYCLGLAFVMLAVSACVITMLSAADVFSPALVPQTGAQFVAPVFANGSEAITIAFERIYNHFDAAFDYAAYNRSIAAFDAGLKRYSQAPVVAQYADGTAAPHCDMADAPSPSIVVSGVSPFPGGAVGPVFSFDLGRRLYEFSQHVQGPASAGLVAPMALSSQALANGMGLVQAAIAALVHVVPPLVPPPAWNNQPLSCVPMAAGHNCFGSVLYPITMADFMLADVTDSMLDGYVASFPGVYARKVGKTSAKMHQICFAAYMGMMCSSVFPRCAAPQSRDDVVPVGGSVPVCLHMCVMPLVMCPGFWVDDLVDSCSSVSVPPFCSQVEFHNPTRIPPQYVTFDEANPFSTACPPSVAALSADKLNLYDAQLLGESPIEKRAIASRPEPGLRL